ncbi:hypothetical protein KVR01_006393 [Diaporthe batatas]|uniref:uncharacterized protein n=1 Tax=Diaporthe batatas TaxID=748121 RepID=UPI001D052358|nr:uncharacterized protein KVR01_006393 [Diaporthe batatas]KAG8164475.1 hypothetical protein KVR01_006393 [Diaporthe batatas]
MDHTNPLAPQAGSTSEMAQADDSEATDTGRQVLSKEVSEETVAFMVDVSRQLFPHHLRVNHATAAVTTLKEYHFTLLMRETFESYATDRLQDFADIRISLHEFLQEDPQHKPLAERFCRLMGLWLLDGHNRRQQEMLESEQRMIRQREERKTKAGNKKNARNN